MSGTTGTNGNLFGSAAVITCPHGGRASSRAAQASDAVLLDGVPVSTAAHTYAVTGCTHTVDGTPVPCTSIRWTADRDGIRVDGAPLLLDVTVAQCFTAGLIPQGPPHVQPAQRGVVAR